MKVCSRCGIEKPFSSFTKRKRSRDGYRGTCKECLKGNARKWEKENPIKSRYVQYKASAKARGKDFNLTFGEFKSYWNQPCYYCGNPIDGIGLDRVNSNIGYHVNNVVPCCTQCNTAKMAVTQSEFFAMIKRIYELHNLEGE